jgi:hypothetical protein
MEIKQEVCDETVYHDAVDNPLDEEDEVDDDNHDDGGHGEEGESEEKDSDSDQGSHVCNDNRLGTIRNFCIEDIYIKLTKKKHIRLKIQIALSVWNTWMITWSM